MTLVLVKSSTRHLIDISLDNRDVFGPKL